MVAMESSTALSAERLRVLLCVPVLVLLTLVPIASGAARHPATERLRDEINRVRAHYGLPAVRLDGRLHGAARRLSGEMASTGVLDHTSPDGSTLTDRLVAAGWHGSMAGEDIAVAPRPAEVVRMWLASPPHRAILLSRGYRSIGLGIAAGRFRGHTMLFFTADFAG